ncbi:hypothetical protein MMC30_003637 [Trapelia coarctata]|nr:hypothetical protein [Trapelia coarctata]
MGKEAASESSPINDTWYNRLLIIAAVKLFENRKNRRGNVLFLSRKWCVKYGKFQHISEAATMQFVAEHTSIPVPRVKCAFKHRKTTYIVMERINGEILGHGWSARSKESKTKILSQLRAMNVELHEIPPPKKIGVANVDGGSLYDGRLPANPSGSVRFGPFESVEDFHLFLRRGFTAHTDHFPEVSELIAQHEEGSWPICFTHADLSSLNILVRGENVVGIIDWETSGWYPSYWEYTTASNVNPRNEFWRQEIDNFLDPMPKELAMEQTRMKYFGDV